MVMVLLLLASPRVSQALIQQPSSPADLPACTTELRFADVPCLGRKAEPSNLAEFLVAPTAAEWHSQLELGWRGPDGSTAAPDEMGGVRVGQTTTSHEASDLPANRHDWYYELGRTYGLGRHFRKAADVAFRDMCLDRVSHLGGVRGAMARADAHFRYAAVRVVGIGAWLIR